MTATSSSGSAGIIRSMTLSDRLARFNRWGPNRLVRTFAGRPRSPVAIVVHRGRTSGRSYRTPVIAFRRADGYVISLPYGADRDWVRNVLAAGSCTVERGGRRVELTDPACSPAATAWRCCRRQHAQGCACWA